VIVRGAGSRTNYLRILDSDGLLMDRKELTGAAVKKLELVTEGFETVPANTPLAFSPGRRSVGVRLYGDVQTSSGPRSEVLVDTSMQLALAGSTRKAWDTLELDATVGTSKLTVTAGDKPPADLDFVVIDHIDSLSVQDSSNLTVSPSSSANVCFSGLGAGYYVAGLTWTYVIDSGAPIVQGDGSLNRNCINVSTQKVSGTIVVQASAGGQSTSVTLTATASARELPGAGIEPSVRATTRNTVDGDRAAM
jgi:hypothetical protein